jgi:ubiquinone/menaquinone biosynthesis C-methylase UbiE
MAGPAVPPPSERERGTGRGKVFPASEARMLELPIRRLVKSPRRLADLVEAAPGYRILELGPGPGFFSRELASRVPDGHLALCDLQPEMLALARPKLPGRPASLVAGDALSLPYRSGSFDAAVLVTVLGEVPHILGALAELHRVLRPRARLVIAEQAGDPEYIPVGRLRDLVEPAGFVLMRRTGTRLSYNAVFLRA